MTGTMTMEEYVKSKGGQRAIKKILIANNGMAATKAIMSMRQWAFLELGDSSQISFVAMASKDDLEANAEFIRLANSFIEVPPGKNINNYKNVELIVRLAKEQGVDAVWPGWGHASEDPELPRTLAAAGITFLGPTAPVMHALGDKIASTILAQSSKVPCIPWNGDGVFAEIQADGSIPQEPFKKACLQNYEEALSSVRRIGYPVVLKASEGGGGKGIRKATNDDELKFGWEQVVAEVPGSPIFMMQLCTGARHLEVQLVGDEYGQVVSLIGRDCSTQRRFQKIFEEGPPTIANKDDFREAEKAAQRLAMSVGYRGAGTVEYLYKPDTKGFFFLELNPRLQVEHPVTEGITGVNVPALQLQIGMGIPMHRVPDVRRFYGLEATGDSKIDFLEDKYVYPNKHVIAARVTAENPDDAFRPTSGKIERVRFQSSPSTWGYFSIGANGGIHEFADSQFGHIFSSGPTREHARKALQLALKSISIVGEIRNPTEYLVELADTDAFVNNTIDTAWLDKLIAEKSVKIQYQLNDMIFYGACLRSFLTVKEQMNKILDGMRRGHLPLQGDLKQMQTFPVELAYDSVKYLWQVVRTGPDSFAMTIGQTTLDARIREQPDGSLYVKCGESTAQISGIEEPLCLRLRVEGQATVTFPRIRDPSELRSDFNGKLVRYLHADGADVAEGEPFAELEAMKMIMSLRATSSGKVNHTLGAGAIVSAGDLLATLVLKDPSKVQMIKPFTGKYELKGKATAGDAANRGRTQTEATDSIGDSISGILCGFRPPARFADAEGASIVQFIFRESVDSCHPDSLATCSRLLGVFLDNERFFAGLVGGDETQIISRFTGDTQQLLSLVIAHDALKLTTDIVCAMLRSLSQSFALEGTIGALPDVLKQRLQELSAFPDDGGYGQAKLLATQLLQQMNKPLNQRRDEVRTTLANTARKDLNTLANSYDTERRMYFGLDLISAFFSDEDASIRSKAAEVYILRTYRGYNIHSIETVETREVLDKTPAASLHLLWSFSPPGVDRETQRGYAILLPDMNAYESLKKSWVMPAGDISDIIILVAKTPDVQDNTVEKHEQALQQYCKSTSDLVAGVVPMLDQRKCTSVNVLLAHSKRVPSYLHYEKASGWKEIPEYRNMRATLPFLIELPQIQTEFDMTPLQHGRIFALDLGTSKDKKSEIVFARGASHVQVGLDTFESTILHDLQTSFEFLERALLSPLLMKKQCSSQIFMHLLPPIPATTERDFKYLEVLFASTVQRCIADHGSRILKLRLTKIEMKVWMNSTPPTPIRLVAHSSQRWETVALREKIDPKSGSVLSWERETGAGVETVSLSDMLRPKVEAQRASKRSAARGAGSTYIYDFPSLFRISLMKMWLKTVSSDEIPSPLVTCKELVLEGDRLVEKEQNGQNTVGMVAWQCTFRTPECPAGREIILIGNDLTVKAGTFGVNEDNLFHKASCLARSKGVPRIFIACNSGARIGGVDELKSVVRVAWNDPNDMMKGFEYLYIPDADMGKVPAGSVEVTPVTVNGEKRHRVEAVIGLNCPSIRGGIGVECLQGSGLIAGETSRAYEETFTLSFVTGRSVGIGAYLNRLGQRNIQMVHGPMILTGYKALNKLLGQQVYTTEDQLGGPHIMVPNGVTHELVQNDQDGVEAILHWLAFVPENVNKIPPMIKSTDPIDRLVQFMPSKSPYDPRHMLAGAKVDGVWQAGFCDEGSFREYMGGWGKTVVVGRGRLGGMPVGIVSVETRAVERHIPADPGNAASRDVKETQAGQVWYPDSAYKTAQAIRDFNKGENLPLVIFANWRGFSGGTRDMFAEVLKYGAMIVDALVDYKHPVTIYIPPNGELRGGAWVVVDPSINADQMEMYADVEARGGILEPAAAAELIFKGDKQVMDMMHLRDSKLQELDKKAAQGDDSAKAAIKDREKLLLPIYRQVSVEYADLHDKSGRMKAMGVINQELKWATSRKFLHWRIRRRSQENSAARRLMESNPEMAYKDAAAALADLSCKAAGDTAGTAREDEAVASWFEANARVVDDRIDQERHRVTEEKIYRLVSSLPAARRNEVVRDLVGYGRVSGQSAP